MGSVAVLGPVCLVRAAGVPWSLQLALRDTDTLGYGHLVPQGTLLGACPLSCRWKKVYSPLRSLRRCLTLSTW
jgi:hypothetical protein